MRFAGSAPNRKKHPASEYGYTVVYQRMPEGGYSVVVPAIPEICSFGETLPEARRMAKMRFAASLRAPSRPVKPFPRMLNPLQNILLFAWLELHDR